MSPEINKKLLTKFGNYFGLCTRETLPLYGDNRGNIYYTFIDCYKRLFSIENWINCFEQYYISVIDRQAVTEDLNMTLGKYNPILLSRLNKYLQNNETTGVKVKLDQTCEEIEQPQFTFEDIWKILKRNNHATLLCLLPWDYNITDTEYRGFVYRSNISALCQKNCYKYNAIPREKVLIIVHKLSEYLSSKKNKIPYHDFIIDFTMWNNVIKLINISPLDLWCGADWKLFNWSDYDKILQTEKIYFKYIEKN